jgi:hypothetical protein
LKLKHYILFFCLFAVIATKTYVAVYTLFSDSDIELSNELDEEGTDDEEDSEEDPEKETKEKDIYISSYHFTYTEQKNNTRTNKTIHYYKNQHYLTPNLESFFSPPDTISVS